MGPNNSLFAGKNANGGLRGAVRGMFSRAKTEMQGFFSSGARIRQFFFTLRSRKHRHANARLVKTCYDMNLSPLIRIGKSLLAGTFATALPLLSFGQSPFVSSSGEYSIGGALAGDQVRPRLGINSAGGYLVWEDNFTDGSGMGISAVALDNHMARHGSPFRVNPTGKGDQENPRVALLNGGGAAFVWQGGRPGFQHIFARFMSPSNTWVSGEIQVNTFNRNSQINPDIAVLTNGNVVVVWASFNQATGPMSMQDIYAQIFSPLGQRIGGEIRVNQITMFNQRTPAVAALSDGRFVIAWVTEQERRAVPEHANPSLIFDPASPGSRPSVDIKAGLFEADGSPTLLAGGTPAPEILVNNVNLDSSVCANPSVATDTNGGFIVAWGQRDVLVRSNGWDIFVIPFSTAGGLPIAGASRCVNTQIYGDQYAPQICALGNNYLVTWTSLGQDGSLEGVYGRFLGTDGSPTSPEIRVNTTTLSRQMHPAVATDNDGRFIAVWTSFVGGNSSFDLYAQQYAVPGYVPPTLASTYAAPPVETFTDITPPLTGSGSGSSGTPPVVPPTLGFPDVPPGSAVLSNAFVAAQGTYNGLFYNADAINPSSAGSFTATVTSRGTYTGKIYVGGKSYPISGSFNPDTGLAVNRVSRGFLRALKVQLDLDLAGGDQIRGSVSDGNWNADLLGFKLVFKKASHASPADTYILRLPGDPQTAGRPGGDGFGTVKMDAGGVVQWSGSLGDGTKVSQKTTLSAQGIWPLYVSLYGGKGCAVGWLQLNNGGLSGPVAWIKQSGVVGGYYPSGFTNAMDAAGVPYHAPAAGSRALNWANGSGQLILGGAGLSQPFTNTCSLDLKNKITPASSAGKLSLTISPTSGYFQGSVINPATGKSMKFQGALFQNWNVGLGYFLAPDQTGELFLGPAP